ERYVCPMHPEVSRAEPATCPICKMALVPRAGSAPAAPARVATPPAKRSLLVSAWAEAARFAAGATWLPATFPPALPTLPGDPPVLGAAKRQVFAERVGAPAWVTDGSDVVAALYRDELVGLAPGDSGTFAPARRPRATLRVKRTADPPASWDGSTVLVRFSVEPVAPPDRAAPASPAPAPSAGETGWLELPDRSRELLVVPESALLRTAEGPYVLVPGAGGHGVERRKLQVGRTRHGQVAVLAGLEAGENVVIANAFLLDSSERSRRAASPDEGGP
ncbi:MAG TPA: heavy metal-binding domain-containing protein, partial [Polyangiaceae bacterium]|nr:heavy metal-binding domain-containing protein [Polyangiaceae bacterium]